MSEVVKPGGTIGILGGGQLGRMLALAGARLGLKSHIYCAGDNSPAFDVAAGHVVAPFDDEAALLKFAQGCDVVTYEFENIPTDTVKIVSRAAPVYPSIKALEAAQDRYREKRFLESLAIPVAHYAPIDTARDLEKMMSSMDGAVLLKTRRFGYDGKGQVRVGSAQAAQKAYEELGSAPVVAEKMIDFDREISVVAVRSKSGETAFYDIGENDHEGGILRRTVVPAAISQSCEQQARAIAAKIVEALDYVGVLAVELFHMGTGAQQELLVNEFAPRVHNSGHWTQNACLTDQFENHMRAVAGWPLGATTRHSDALMVNLLGDMANDWSAYAAKADHMVHLYGKREARAGRKMGHVNIITAKTER